MKKLFYLSLAIGVLCCASCKDKDNKNNKDNNTQAVNKTEIKGSTAFVAGMNYYEKLENAMTNCKSCEDLDNAQEQLIPEFDTFLIALNEETPTEKEKKLLSERIDKVNKLYDKLAQEFGCSEASDSNDTSENEEE